MRVLTGRLFAVSALAVIAVISACNPTPSPSASVAPTPDDTPQAIVVLKQWLAEHTLACAAPVAFGNRREWTCLKDMGATGEPNPPERTVYRVLLVAEGSTLREIEATVDQRADEKVDIDRARGFLADTIGGSHSSGAAAPAVTTWVVGSLTTGGTRPFGGMTATLSPFGPVTELRLFFSPS